MAGQIEVDYPFVRDTFYNVDVDGQGFSDESWRPGTKHVIEYPDGESTPVAHGLGKMLLTVVKRVEMPRRLAERVFYQRRWRDPDGREFGKRTIRVTTAAGFTRLLSGYRYRYKLDAND